MYGNQKIFGDIINKLLNESYFNFFKEEIELLNKYMCHLRDTAFKEKNIKIDVINPNDIKRDIRIDYTNNQPNVAVFLYRSITLQFENSNDLYDFKDAFRQMFNTDNKKNLLKMKSLLDLYRKYELVYEQLEFDDKEYPNINTVWFGISMDKPTLSTGIYFNHKWLINKLKESGKEVKYYTREERIKMYASKMNKLRTKLIPFLTEISLSVAKNNFLKKLDLDEKYVIKIWKLSREQYSIDELLFPDYHDSTNLRMYSEPFIGIDFNDMCLNGDEDAFEEALSDHERIIDEYIEYIEKNILNNLRKIYLSKLKSLIDDISFEWERYDYGFYCSINFVVNYDRL
jgi:hypothetical protein